MSPKRTTSLSRRLSLAILPALLAITLLPRATQCAADAQSVASKGRPFRGSVGLELYSLRRELDRDVATTLAKVRELGFVEVEVANLHGLPAEQFRLELDKNRLKCVSFMAPYEVLRDDIDGVIRDAKALGARYVVVAWIPHRSDFKPEDCRRAASDFNRWGEKLKAAGLVFGYHPHGYEFRAHGDGTLLDLLIAETRPELVTFEMDVFWVVHGGGDPVQLMKKYPRRFAMMHLKDMKKGTAVGIPTGNAPDDTNVVIGTGQIDFKAILREAVRIGMKHYFIEDESVEAINQLPLSLDYLRRLRL